MNEPTHPALELDCPDCGNNRQVWSNQISGEKICHRAGCHMTVCPTPHPLAVEAAEKIFNQWEVEPYAIAPIIHTTALEPVLKVGEDLYRVLLTTAEALGGLRTGAEAEQALSQWRTLTSPKTPPQSPLEGSRSDFDAKSGSGERKGGL